MWHRADGAFVLIGRAAVVFAVIFSGLSLWCAWRREPFDQPMTTSAHMLIALSWLCITVFILRLIFG